MKTQGVNTCNGWTDDGLELFNTFVKRICKDRKTNGKEFDKTFTKTMLEETNNSKENKK